jgi:hypothetical protein
MSKPDGVVLRIGRDPVDSAEHLTLPSASASFPAAEPVETAGNLDKVRDILFGSQLREVEKKLQRLEDKLQKDLSELREEVRRRGETQEHKLKLELDALSDRLRSEREGRDDAVLGVHNALKDHAAATQKRHAQIDEQISRAQRDLRQQLADHSGALSDEIRRRSEELLSLLSKSVGELREEKTDKRQLVALFGELALRLNGDGTGSAG